VANQNGGITLTEQKNLLWESMNPQERATRLQSVKRALGESVAETAYADLAAKLEKLGISSNQHPILLRPNGKFEINPHPVEQIHHLRRAMDYNNWSLADVGRVLNLSGQCIRSWVDNGNIPNRANRAKITRFLQGVSLMIRGNGPGSRVVISSEGKLIPVNADGNVLRIAVSSPKPKKKAKVAKKTTKKKKATKKVAKKKMAKKRVSKKAASKA